ncbi:MAG: glycosyltransferase family 4 protein [Saprospiraceae bacterium]
MKILFITHYSRFLGANRSLLHLIKGLQSNHGAQVRVLCPEPGDFVEELKKANIEHAVIPFCQAAYTIRSKKLYLYPLYYWRYRQKSFESIVQYVRAFDPDAIHSNSSVLRLGADLSDTLQIPHIWHIREFGWKDYRLVFPFGKKQTLRRMALSNAVICISDIIRQGWNLQKAANAHTIYNGVGTNEQIAQRKGNQPDKTTFNLLLIGLLHPQKGQLDGLKALRKLAASHPQIRLSIAGNGRFLYTQILKWYTRFFGLQKQVVFTGYVPNPSSLYQESDVVLMCSRNEAMGRVTAEAMSYGKPVIGKRAGATPELIREGDNGFLYTSIAELAAHIHQLESDRDQCKKMGAFAHKTACAQFTDERYTQAMHVIFKASCT